MTKRLALAVCTVAAAFAAVLSGTATTAPFDGGASRVTAGDRPVIVVTTTGTTSGSDRPKPPTDTSWGG
ncbi:hypothetical protein ABZ330_30760 [Streptomyces sp. NPDC006172]|uniref:hypothetical protein n=1 Tax=Streptomyces sp. NPDC006172 TaxID=3154470 RepID=UPI0033D82705